ncbi:nucleotidyltransferase family protein [Aromatoleum anaerobium]|uniref:Nucleotidyltransferase n=1 Tax=Aromatoleum anaerobium TaxID=182180 RepID=A0ABX1PIH0_9RHOO|nr:nucleotidyltransferase domain-containing protein [Aromatoleum anaerobium]MCK0507508.1 nucleotidyltransferase domain-containing protein [Aromatoleum anaerobium]
MKPSEALRRHRVEILALATRHRAYNVRVFGSVSRGDDRDDSDLDLLVEFGPDASLFDAFALQEELESLLALKVEVATPGGLHPLIRTEVMREARPL